MRLSLTAFGTAVALATLTACAPTVPDSAAGVGFGDYNSYMRARTAQATPPRVTPPRQVNDLTTQRPASTQTATTRTAAPQGAPTEARSIAAQAVAAVRPSAPPQPQQTAATNEPIPAGAATIYRDQVLDMETARATRDAEQAAFERRRSEFQMVEATALPDRPSDVPNITAFALSTTNAPGQQVHRRSRLTTQNHARNCLSFPSDDVAQEEFLRRGGPQRDPLNLDPDGDGFACNWSPEPLRAAARAAN